MKAEKIYYALIKTIDFCEELHALADEIGNDKLYIISHEIKAQLETLQEDAAEQVRRDAAKQTGRATIYAAAMRILKAANAAPREGLHGAHRSADGYIDICDGFRLLRLNADTAPELPERAANLPEYINAARILPRGFTQSDPVHLPDPAELRAHIKTEKARKKAIKDKTPPEYAATTEAGAVILFNAQFLLDMLEALPDAKAYAASTRASLSGVIFEAENGRGYLMPLKPPKQ